MGSIREIPSRAKPLRFLDASIFIYAYYRPRRRITGQEEKMKSRAKEIVGKISDGREDVMTTVVHLSEMTNILKQGMPLDDLYETIFGLLTLDNVNTKGVSKEDYTAATELAAELRLDPNDALSVQFMRLHDINEIYSFDKDFERVKGITRLPAVK